MTCRHQPGDPSCSSHPDNVAARQYEYETERRTKAELEQTIRELRAQIALTPDSQRYTIEDVEQVGNHVVLRVKYPNCAKCAYEGNKVMVFLDVTVKDVCKWNRIDPHFRSPSPTPRPVREAPAPAARFPGNLVGWTDALEYARSKRGGM